MFSFTNIYVADVSTWKKINIKLESKVKRERERKRGGTFLSLLSGKSLPFSPFLFNTTLPPSLPRPPPPLSAAQSNGQTDVQIFHRKKDLEILIWWIPSRLIYHLRQLSPSQINGHVQPTGKLRLDMADCDSAEYFIILNQDPLRRIP